jgi:hypothetical protein
LGIAVLLPGCANDANIYPLGIVGQNIVAHLLDVKNRATTRGTNAKNKAFLASRNRSSICLRRQLLGLE